MTQEELAGELNVTRQALSNWERDVNEPDLNMLKKNLLSFWSQHGRFCEGACAGVTQAAKTPEPL
ncbi:helix-turn-helix transcriptional regulator [Lactobacillus crispatus]|uniref:helix-turn-helix transcriptional regulator n=1 Tax=Lactobacillus crispatus TaxID=47770 RepID=UPI0021DF88E6|nr:helix-turn-helix transcriptional regulator [Lactobacillus crispatus]